MVETLQEVKGDMIRAGLKWNKRTHTLFVEVHLLECNTEVIASCGNICTSLWYSSWLFVLPVTLAPSVLHHILIRLPHILRC